MNIKTCKFVDSSDLTCNYKWSDWFWNRFSEGAPFSWGDNNRTLVDVDSFTDHCETFMDDGVVDGELTEEEKEEFFAILRRIDPNVYIDLEN